MASVFDSEKFTASCFFPRADRGPPPPGARDLQVAVDGASLHLRLHEQVEGAPTVLFFHGNAEVVSDYDDLAEHYVKQRLNLAVVDFRGYGASTGSPTLRTMISDAAAILEAAATQTKRPLIVMGRSLGSACALELFQRDDPRIAGVILESGFIDLPGLVRRRSLPPARFSEEDLATFDPRRKVAKGQGPLLIIHGENDRSISADEAREALSLATSPRKHLAIIPGRGHNDVSASPEYWQAIAHVWTWPAFAKPPFA